MVLDSRLVLIYLLGNSPNLGQNWYRIKLTALLDRRNSIQLWHWYSHPFQIVGSVVPSPVPYYCLDVAYFSKPLDILHAQGYKLTVKFIHGKEQTFVGEKKKKEKKNWNQTELIIGIYKIEYSVFGW